jgi:hypothetical protein
LLHCPVLGVYVCVQLKDPQGFGGGGKFKELVYYYHHHRYYFMTRCTDNIICFVHNSEKGVRNFMSCSNFSWIDGGGGGGGAREKEQPLSDKHREVCSYE